jgi:hypothetical protein
LEGSSHGLILRYYPGLIVEVKYMTTYTKKYENMYSWILAHWPEMKEKLETDFQAGTGTNTNAIQTSVNIT